MEILAVLADGGGRRAYDEGAMSLVSLQSYFYGWYFFLSIESMVAIAKKVPNTVKKVSLVSDIPAGDGKIANLFYRIYRCLKISFLTLAFRIKLCPRRVSLPWKKSSECCAAHPVEYNSLLKIKMATPDQITQHNM